MIDLRSDTVTRPTEGMMHAMMTAPVGDDVLGDDPTVVSLEAYVADMFGHQAALFCPSGTMANQIAVQIHCGRLDEVIVDETSHIYKYETGGYAYISGAAIQAIATPDGHLSSQLVTEHLHPDHDWLPRSRLVSIENTCNRAGGSVYTVDEMKGLSDCCAEHGLKYHLDGARLFNALVHSDLSAQEVGPLFHTLSVCLSKGLGAPVGSVLIGSQEDIYRARRLRKVMGGGMRQVGLLAAAGRYALDHHVDRLRQDHEHASMLATALDGCSWVEAIKPQETNIVLFQVDVETKPRFDQKMVAADIAVSQMGEGWYRMVTHLDISSADISKVIQAIEGI